MHDFNTSSKRSFGPLATRGRTRPAKPNTLPVLNCLFAALNNNNNNNEEDETPYLDVPATPDTSVYLHAGYGFNNNQEFNGCGTRLRKMGGSYTQDDLRWKQSDYMISDFVE